MKRIIYVLLIAIAVLGILGGVSAFADYDAKNSTRDTVLRLDDTEADELIGNLETGEADAAEGDPRDGSTDSAADITDDGASVTGGEGADANAPTDVPDDGTDGAESVNPFASFFETVRAYATEIFCSLTFIGSLLLAYAYKKGLIPLLQGGISAISGTVSKIKESAERGESKTDELTRAVCDRLTEAEVCLEGMSETLAELAKKLDGVSADKDEARKMKLVMSAQVDMLYSIFMTSSLPQYQKDEVGEKIREMKEALLADEGEGL